MVQIHLYGVLRNVLADQSDNQPPLDLPATNEHSLDDILRQIQVSLDEIGHIFINGKLAYTRSSMAPYLGYQRSIRISGTGSLLDLPIRPGDRLGIFPANMAMLVV